MKINLRNLELFLAQNQMTASELSERSGVCKQSISIIRYRGTCQPVTLAKIAKGLGVDPADLIEKAKD